MAFGKRQNPFGMLGAYQPSGSSKPGKMPTIPGTGGSKLVNTIRSGTGLKTSSRTRRRPKSRRA